MRARRDQCCFGILEICFLSFFCFLSFLFLLLLFFVCFVFGGRTDLLVGDRRGRDSLIVLEKLGCGCFLVVFSG